MEAGSKKENSIFFNHSFDKKRLKTLISWVFKKFGEAEALRVLDLLKETGFRHATKAGISIGVHDLTTPIQKSWLISESQLAMNITDRDFIGAKITATERSQRIIDTWHRASESLSKQVVDYFGIYDQFNPVYIMALSGARGNFSQVRQLIGMRGLMADQQGKIVNFPILSNLREGLTLTEYFISCSGARKGLVDTALRTADTGYLTRRLVDVSHNVVVKRIRCNTNRGIAFKSLQSYNKVLLALKERLVGRVLAEDIELEASPLQKKDGGFITSTGLAGSRSEQLAMQIENESQRVIAKKDQEISPKLSLKIARVRDKVFIRSPLTCGFTNEVCQLCYGWSISQGSLVSLGDAVGVIAAQSIGEPGTQLTMRTFHTGGVFSGDLLQEIRAPHPGTIQFSKAFQGLLIRTAHGRIAFLSKTKGNLILSKDNYFTEMPIQAFTMLFVKQGEEVKSNQLLAEYSIQSKEGNQPIKTQQTIFAELSGRVIEDRSGAIYTKPIKESLLLLDPLQDSFSTPFSEETKLLSSACPSLPYPFSPCACKYKASLCKKICMRNPSVPLPVPVPLRGKGTGTGKKGVGMGSPNPLKGVKATAGDGVARSSQGCTYKSSYKAPLCTCKRDLAPGALASTKRSFVRRFASASPYLPLRGTGRQGLRMQIFLQSSALYLQALPYGEGVGKHGKKGIVATPLHGKKVDYRKLQKFKKEIVFLLAKKRKKETDVHTELHIANKIGKNTKKGSRALCKYKALLCKKIFTGTAVCPPTCPYLPVRLQIEDLHAQPMRFAQPAGDGGRACKSKICMRKPRRGTQIYDLQRGTASGRAHRGKKGEKGGRRGKKGEVGGARREDNQIYKPQILSSLKNEDFENDVFKYVEPVKSGRLGFLKILSTRVGATLDYMCPIKPFDYYLIKKKRRRSALFERSNGSPFFLFSKPVLAARFLEAQLGTPVVDESKSYGKLHLEEVRRPQIGGFRFALPARTPAKGFGEEEAQVRSFASSKENDLKENTLRQNKEIRVKKAVKYLHPEYIKENRFFLQTIAEYGDIVEEEYKTKII